MTGLREGTFAIGTFDARAGAFPAVVRADGSVIDASGAYPTTRAMLEDWEAALDALEKLAHDGEAAHELAGLRALPPIEPRQILQAGANYYNHVLHLIVAEQRQKGVGEDEALVEGRRIMDARVAGGEPYVFLGAVSAMTGAEDDVVLPPRGKQHDWELELAAVLGPGEEIAGYTICNDLTTRDQLYREDLKAIGTDWLRAKNSPTFLPTGPFIVPARFVPDTSALQITLRHNGDVMQDESTSDMIFDVERLLDYTRERVRLYAGDLLLTGSPAGNGARWGRFLSPGDVMEAEITGLGRQRNRCVSSE